MKQKKGIELNQAFGAVLMLVLIGVLVIIGIFMFVNLGDTFVNLATASSNDEVVDMSAGGPKTLSNGSLCNVGSFAISSIANGSAGGTVIAPGNYSISNTGVLNNLTTTFTGNDWYVNSTSNWGGPACTSNDSMITQFATYPVLVGLVGTIIFLGWYNNLLRISYWSPGCIFRLRR